MDFYRIQELLLRRGLVGVDRVNVTSRRALVRVPQHPLNHRWTDNA